MSLVRRIARLSSLIGIVVVLGAGAPNTSPHPVPRPGSNAESVSTPAILPNTHPSTRAQEAGLGVILQNIFRPIPRRGISDAVAEAAAMPSYNPSLAIALSPRPVLRPSNLVSAIRVQPPAASAGSRSGSVCGERQIRGVVLAAIRSNVEGCGVANPVRVSSISGVRLTQDSVMDCNTAKTLNTWVREGVIPAVGRRGRGLDALRVVAHYSCRTRNNRAGAKISEHGKGHAIDIAGLILKNGDRIDFLDDWSNGQAGRILHAMHSSACGPFGTVLGPDANRAHLDHLHADTAQYSGGAYCR